MLSARSRRDAMETMVPFLLLVLNLDASALIVFEWAWDGLRIKSWYMSMV